MIKCYDVAEEVIVEATDRFIGFVENEEKKHSIIRICSMFDALAEEFEGVAFEVSIDEVSTDITIVIECGEIIVEIADHTFYDLLRMSKDAHFSTGEGEDIIKMSLTFDGIWDKR